MARSLKTKRRSKGTAGKRPKGARPAQERRRRKNKAPQPAAAAAIEPCVGWLRRRGNSTWVEPDPPAKAVFIRDHSAAACSPGDAVRFRIVQAAAPERGAAATILACLGQGERDGTLLKMASAQLGLPIDFPADALEQASQFGPVQPTAALADGERRDLRAITHVTIDGEDARDFDDAIAVRREGEYYRIWIAIADVASYVTPGTALDREARQRGTSVYLPDQVLPMLPERLSSDLCSLRPGEARHTLTCEMRVDASGKRSHSRIYPSLICSAARLNYTQLQRFIEGDLEAIPGPLASMLEQAVEVAKRLRKRRLGRGSLDLEIPEPRVLLDAAGEPTDVVAQKPLPAHQVIEDLMIAANESVAEYLREQNMAGVFRVHPPPPQTKWSQMEAWSKTLGFTLKREDAAKPKNISRFLKRLKQTPQGETAQFLLLRSLSQAHYTPQVDLHFGLASEAYLHFTSPIRRYPDLLVHRALWHHWRGENDLRGLESLSRDCSLLERRAVQAEREISHLAACLVARRRSGEEMAARITGIHAAGLFVRPDEFYAEGLIPIESLGRRNGDYFEVWEEAQKIIGRGTGLSYALGDALKVRLVQVDIGMRRINFEVTENISQPRKASAMKSRGEKDRGAGKKKEKGGEKKRDKGKRKGKKKGKGKGKRRT